MYYCNKKMAMSYLVHTVETTPELNIYNLTFEGSVPEKLRYFLLGQQDPSKYIYIYINRIITKSL